VIAVLDLIEAARAIGDHPGKHVEAPGRAFWIGGGRKPGRQRQTLDQWHDVDAPGLQHRTIAEIDLVQFETIDALADGRVPPRQKARAHTEGGVAESEIQARRLNLIGCKRIGGQDRAVGRETGDHPVRQNALVSDREGERHGAPLQTTDDR
jgi:hypothetical protein